MGCDTESSSAVPHDPFLLPLPVAFLDVGALVVLLLALGQADFQLGATMRPVQVERDQGVARAFDLADQARQLPPVQQQLARARGVGDLVRAGVLERREVGADQEGLAVLDGDVGLGDLRPSGAQTLRFPAAQGQAGLVPRARSSTTSAPTSRNATGNGRRKGSCGTALELSVSHPIY